MNVCFLIFNTKVTNVMHFLIKIKNLIIIYINKSKHKIDILSNYTYLILQINLLITCSW